MPGENDSTLAPPLPAAPRPVGPKARRRSWGERGVRPWWLSAAVLALFGLYLASAQLVGALRDRWLIEHGTLVDAEIIEVAGLGTTKTIVPEANRLFTMRFMQPGSGIAGITARGTPDRNAVGADSIPAHPDRNYDNEERYLVFTSGALKGISRRIKKYDAGRFQLQVYLPGTPAAGDEFLADCTAVVVTGHLKDQRRPLGYGLGPAASVIELRVDPNNLSRWTDRQSANFMQNSWLALCLLGAGVVAFVVALIKRRQALASWRYGQAMAAVVVDSHQSALAPQSRLVRFTLRDGRDKRVIHALLPSRLGMPQPGQLFWLVAPPARPGRAVVAELYL